MFGLSGEHLLILAGILLIFGPRKLPELGSSVGKALRNFKEGLNQPPTSGQIESRPVAQNLAAPVSSVSVMTPENSPEKLNNKTEVSSSS